MNAELLEILNAPGANLALGISGGMYAAVGLFVLICYFKLYQKGGEKGWKCLIPIYNGWMLYKLGWKTKEFWARFFVTLAAVLAAAAMALGLSLCFSCVYFGDVEPERWMVLLVLAAGGVAAVLGIVILVMRIRFYVHLSRSYGEEGAFAIGLLFVKLIFIAIMAFDEHRYVGPDR